MAIMFKKIDTGLRVLRGLPRNRFEPIESLKKHRFNIMNRLATQAPHLNERKNYLFHNSFQYIHRDTDTDRSSVHLSMLNHVDTDHCRILRFLQW